MDSERFITVNKVGRVKIIILSSLLNYGRPNPICINNTSQ